MSEEEYRRLEIRVLDLEGEVVFEVSGNVSRETSHKFLEGVGYAFIPQEPMPRIIAVPARAIGKISCKHDRDCTDYPNECPKCAENRAKSYFKPKKVEK